MDVKERFDLGDSVGRDELGEVLRATERSSGKNAAIKRFDSWALASDKGREAYAAALNALRRIRPARIPPVAAYSMTAESGWIASRWVDAPTLDSMLSAGGTLSPEVTASLGCGMLDALEELHSTGHAHGALSTRKVLVAGAPEAGSVVITDPFQHYLFSVSDPIKTSRTEPARYLGLPEYFSPEQAQGKPPTPASDMYAVGLILYEMLTGKSPFASNKVGTTLKRHIFEKPLKLRLAKPGLQTPDGLEDVILRALEKDPAKRFESVIEFRRALNAVRTDNAEASIERLATPLGIAPVGVLAGEAVPTDDPEEGAHAPDAAPSMPADGDPSPDAAEAAPESPAPEGADDAEPVAETSPPAEETKSEPSEPSESDAPASEPAEGASDEPAAAADASTDDSDSERDSDADDNASGSSRRSRKSKKTKKSRRGGGRNQDSMSVAAVQTGDNPAVSDTDSSPADTVSLAKPAVADNGSRQQIKLAASTSAPLDVESEDELGWFAEGQNEESLAQQFHIPQVHSDEAGRNSRLFMIGVGVLIVLAIGGMAVVSSSVPGDEGGTAATEERQAAASDDRPAPEVAPTAPSAADPEPEAQQAEAEAAPSPDAVAEEEASAPTEAAPEVAPVGAVDEEPASDVPEGGSDEPAAADTAAETPEPPAAEPEEETVVAAVPEPEPARTEPARTEPARTEPARTEPARTEPARTEPAPPAPARQAPEADNAAAEEAAAEARREQADDLARQGDSARNSGNDARATELYNQAIELNRSQANAHFGLGEIAFANQQFAQAVTHFRSATRSSRRAEYHTRLGMAYYRMGNVEASIESLETAVERGDSSAQTMLDRLRERQ